MNPSLKLLGYIGATLIGLGLAGMIFCCVNSLILLFQFISFT